MAVISGSPYGSAVDGNIHKEAPQQPKAPVHGNVRITHHKKEVKPKKGVLDKVLARRQIHRGEVRVSCRDRTGGMYNILALE